MSIIKWEDPGPKLSGRKKSFDVDQVVMELQSRPGQWALVRESVTSGHMCCKSLKQRGCEITQRSNGDGTVRAFARWPKA